MSQSQEWSYVVGALMEIVNKFAVYNVLLVDDDEEMCEIIKFYLSKIETIKSIVTAHDGVSAARKLSNQKFDLILLDMKMPRKNGYDILDEFKNNPFNSIDKVIAMSGTMDVDIVTINTLHGVRTFLVKPFQESLFRQKVACIIDIEELRLTS